MTQEGSAQKLSENEEKALLCIRDHVFLPDLECSFGRRNTKFTLGDISVSSEGPYAYADNHTIDIALGNNVFKDGSLNESLAVWQLAHECVHLLDPINGGSNNATVFEEGLATYYQNKDFGDENIAKYLEDMRLYDSEGKAANMFKEFRDCECSSWICDDKDIKYIKAKELINKYINAFGISKFGDKVRHLRKSGVSLKKLTSKDLTTAFMKISSEDAETLAENFSKWKCNRLPTAT